MINRQANILFIPTSIGGNSAGPPDALSQLGYYEQLIYASLARSIDTVEGFQILGKQLAALARHAFLARQMDAVEQASQMMLVLPISDQLRSIARYYQALCIKDQGDFDEARRSLEHATEKAPPQYRARALQAIGLTHHRRGEVDAALPFYLAAGKAAASCDLLTLAESQETIAVIRSMHGDHKQALADLEGLFPLVRAIGKYYPAAYYNFLNSLAVELAEVGRIAEAEAALSITLASPFATAYPEWSETRDEIAAKRVSATPSVVAFNRTPEADASPKIEPQRKPYHRLRLLSSTWLASEKTSVQRSSTVASALNFGGITLLILYCLRKCVRTRGPPALSRRTFRPLSRNIVESAEGKASTEQNQLTLQHMCAQYCRFVAVIGVCVSLRFRNCSSRAPPLRRDGVSDAGSVNRLITTSNVHCFKADYRHDSHLLLIPRREVTPRSQFASFQKIWASRHVGDSLPHLSRTSSCGRNFRRTNTRSRAGGYV